MEAMKSVKKVENGKGRISRTLTKSRSMTYNDEHDSNNFKMW